MSVEAPHKAFMTRVLVTAGDRRLYLNPSQAPQLRLHQHGARTRGHTPAFFKHGGIAGERLFCSQSLWKGIRPAAGPVSAALSEKTGGGGGFGSPWQSDLQLVSSGHFSVQKHRTRDRHDLDGQKPGRCASIGGFRDRFKTRLIPAFSSAHC